MINTLKTENATLKTENEALKAECEDLKREATIPKGRLEQAAATAVTAIEQIFSDADEDGTEVNSVNVQPENGTDSESKTSKKVCI